MLCLTNTMNTPYFHQMFYTYIKYRYIFVYSCVRVYLIGYLKQNRFCFWHENDSVFE